MNPVQQVRRPLIGIALSVAAGLWFERVFHFSPLLFLAISAFALAWLCYRQSAVLVYAIWFLLAVACGGLTNCPNVPQTVLLTTETVDGDSMIEGTVVSDPVSQTGRAQFRFAADTVYFDGKRFKASGPVQVYLRNPPTGIAYGQRWKLKGKYTAYESRRCNAAGFLRATDAAQTKDAGISLIGWCHQMRHKASRALEGCPGISPEQVSLLRALLLGCRGTLPERLHQIFSFTGTLHIFAISGLHVGVMAAILVAVLKFCGVSLRVRGLLLIPALFFYVAATGMKPSALRAFTMAAIYFAAPLAGRRPDISSAIALAAILLLAVNPLQISDPGFLLSFTVVSGIVMVYGFAVRQIRGFQRAGWAQSLNDLAGPHPFAALLRSGGLLVLTSVAAWLFSMPLTAYFFNTFSPVALAVNPLIIPLTFIIVLTGSLILFTGGIFPVISGVFSYANGLFIQALTLLIEKLAAVPGAWRFVSSPPGWTLFLWYGGLALFFCGPPRTRRPAVLLSVCSLLLWAVHSQLPVRDVQIITTRSSTAFELPGHRWVLVSDGDAFDAGQMIRLLKKEGVNRLHALGVSRIDSAATGVFTDMLSVQKLFELKKTGRLCWPAGSGKVCVGSDAISRTGQETRLQSPVRPPDV